MLTFALILVSAFIFTDSTPLEGPVSDDGHVSIDSRIMGGHKTSISYTPYQVALLDKNNLMFCGGSIIHKRFVLSAGMY
jgi:secreted trypsin-like serine protease